MRTTWNILSIFIIFFVFITLISCNEANVDGEKSTTNNDLENLNKYLYFPHINWDELDEDYSHDVFYELNLSKYKPITKDKLMNYAKLVLMKEIKKQNELKEKFIDLVVQKIFATISEDNFTWEAINDILNETTINTSIDKANEEFFSQSNNNNINSESNFKMYDEIQDL